MRAARDEIAATLARLRAAVRTVEGHRDLDQIERAEAEHQEVVDRFLAAPDGATAEAVLQAYQQQVAPKRDEMESSINAFVAFERRVLADASQASTDSATQSVRALVLMTIVAIGLSMGIAFFLTRALTSRSTPRWAACRARRRSCRPRRPSRRPERKSRPRR